MAIHRTKKARDFTMIAGSVLRDRGMSLAAAGLLCKALALKDDWRITEQTLASLSADGASGAFRTALNELIRAGHAVKSGGEFIIHEAPAGPQPPDESGRETAPLRRPDADKKGACGSFSGTPPPPDVVAIFENIAA